MKSKLKLSPHAAQAADVKNPAEIERDQILDALRISLDGLEQSEIWLANAITEFWNAIPDKSIAHAKHWELADRFMSEAEPIEKKITWLKKRLCALETVLASLTYAQSAENAASANLIEKTAVKTRRPRPVSIPVSADSGNPVRHNLESQSATGPDFDPQELRERARKVAENQSPIYNSFNRFCVACGLPKMLKPSDPRYALVFPIWDRRKPTKREG